MTIAELGDDVVILACAIAAGVTARLAPGLFAEGAGLVELDVAGLDAEAAVRGLRAYLEGCPASRGAREPVCAELRCERRSADQLLP